MNTEIDILVAGKPAKKIPHQGKIFIVAKEGQQYEVRLRNHSTNRLTAVVAIDGVNVVDGETAVPKGGGYIIPAYGAYTVKGFRTSNQEVHPFIFNRKERSYAAKSENGNINDAGVIGVVFWSEKEKKPEIKIQKEYVYIPYEKPVYPKQWIDPHPYRPPFYYLSGNGTSGYSSTTFTSSAQCYNNSGPLRCATEAKSVMMNAVSEPTSFDLGTQFSKKVVEDSVETVDFEWGRNLGKLEIYYASREVLKQMGVPVDQARGVTFPESFKPQGFCKPPKE